MKISGAHVLALPQERAYQVLQDPEVLARCMPGCEALVRIGENEYQMKMKMALASFSGLFDGTIKIVAPEPPSSFQLIVEGKGKIGFMKGDGRLKLTPEGAAHKSPMKAMSKSAVHSQPSASASSTLPPK